MKKSIAMKWVAELRSGKHRQARGSLKNADGSMCCLGVLCAEVLKIPHELDRRNNIYTFGKYVACGDLHGENLSRLNDIGLPEEGLEPFTFDEIADLIQINWKDL